MRKTKQDYFWNFRDISKYNKHIKSDFIYRSSALCLIKDEKILLEKLNKHNIRTIIDLRANREIAEFDYSDNLKSKFNIVNTPFDPWNQSIEFKNTYNTGTNIEIAYSFFSVECNESINKIAKIILSSEYPIVIHCHAGKDRTGIVISIFHLLSEADNKTVYDDYLASEMDTQKEYIDILLNIIKKKGGIHSYLLDCGLTNNEIKQLKSKLRNGSN